MQNRPAVKTLIPYLAGIILADRLNSSAELIYILSTTLLISVFILYKKRWLSTSSALLVLVLLSIGFLRYETAMTPPDGLKGLLYQQVKIRGTVVESKKEQSGGSSLIVDGKAVSISDPSAAMSGKILIRSWEEIFSQKYGDIVEIEGELRQPNLPRNPGAFNYRNYLRRLGIFATVNLDDVSSVLEIGRSGNRFLNWTKELRGKIETIVDETVPPSSAPVLKGITLGDRAALSEDTYEAFLRTSTAHILAVSGLHIGIIAGWVFLVCRWLKKLLRIENKYIAYIPVIPIIIIYACMIGFRVSVVRASALVILAIGAAVIDRDTDLLNVLAAAALGILIYRPGAIWDAGFQLSFGAVASIAYFMPYCQKILSRIERDNWYRKTLYRTLQSISVSWSAQIGAMLILAYTFKRVSVIGAFVNPIIIPFVSLIVPIAFISYVVGLIYLPLASVFGHVNHILIQLLTYIVSYFASFSFSQVSIAGFSFLHAIVLFAVAIFIAKLPALLKQKRRLAIATLAFLTVCVWAGALSYNGRILKVTYLSVGDGDSIFVDLPNGRNILIDGGPYSSDFDTGKRIVAPFLEHEGVGRLDLVISSHPHNDHAGGLTYVVDSFRINELITGSYGLTTPTYEQLLIRVSRKGMESESVQVASIAGSYSPEKPGFRFLCTGFGREAAKFHDAHVGTILRDGKLHVEILGPQFPDESGNEDSRMNNNSVVLRVVYGKTAFLFAGDIEREAEFQLVNSGRDITATVLKVPHQGSKTSSSWEFLRAVQPTIGIISAGRYNRYGHPSPMILGRYRWLGIDTFRTDQQGAITIVSDGRHGWLRNVYGYRPRKQS